MGPLTREKPDAHGFSIIRADSKKKVDPKINFCDFLPEMRA